MNLFGFLSMLAVASLACFLNLSILWAEGVIAWNFLYFLMTGIIVIGYNIFYSSIYSDKFKRGGVDLTIFLPIAVLTGFIVGILATEWLTRWTHIIPVLP